MELAKKSASVTRRQFIGYVWALASVALIAQAGGALYQFLKPTVQPGGFGSKLTVGNVKEFKVGSVSTIREMHGFVSRVSPQGALVLSWRCTHLGCTVPWVDAEKRFHCPCHGSIYDAKGVVLEGPAPRPLDIYPAEVVGTALVVDTSRVLSRDHFEDSQLTAFPPGA